MPPANTELAVCFALLLTGIINPFDLSSISAAASRGSEPGHPAAKGGARL